MEHVVLEVGDFSTAIVRLALSINVLLKSTCEIDDQLRQCLQQLIIDDFPAIQNKLGLIQSYLSKRDEENNDNFTIKSEEEGINEEEEMEDWIVIPDVDNLEEGFENVPERANVDDDDNSNSPNFHNSDNDDDDYIPEEKVKKKVKKPRKPVRKTKTPKVKTPKVKTPKVKTPIIPRRNRTETFLCPNCGKSYRDKYYLENHVKTHDPNYIPGPRFECDTCTKSFSYKVALKKHKVAVHGEGPKLLCPQCGAIFKHLDVLRGHVKNVHEKVRPHMCHHCPKSFKMKTHLQYHLKTHEGESAGRKKERSLNLERKGNNPVRCKFNVDEFTSTNNV